MLHQGAPSHTVQVTVQVTGEVTGEVGADLRPVAMTLPDKPRSRLQKYQLTAKGRVLQEQVSKAGRPVPSKDQG